MSQEREAKLKALRLTMEKLDKTYGKGAVMLMGDKAVEEGAVGGNGGGPILRPLNTMSSHSMPKASEGI